MKLITSLLALALLAGACSGAGSGAAQVVEGEGPIIAVADQPIADLVRRVAGEGYRVEALVPVGADSHTYEPQPRDAAVLATADLFVESGFGLNEAVTDLALANLADDAEHVQLARSIPPQDVIYTDSAEEIAAHGHGHEVNAHFWPDVEYAIGYVEEIVFALGRLAPDGRDGFRERGEALTAELEALSEAIATTIASIPAEDRKLVVYHDAWSYFGRRYGIDVVGAIQPTDFSEPSAAEVRTIIEQIRAEDVPAFFGSEVFPSDVLDAVAEETGAAYVADLSDDVLPGEPGDPEHSYAGMMAANARTMAEALGGDPSPLDGVVGGGAA